MTGRTVWSIGIYQGDSPVSLRPAPGIENPILTAAHVKDVEAAFVADPFMLLHNNVWHLFCEVKNARTRNGEIGFATSIDGFRWEYSGTVLREPFHLSYPCVFQASGEFFMTLESLAAGSVVLYQARAFPHDWQRVATLVNGTYADPTLFHYDGRWWLFACPRPWKHDELHIFHSRDLMSGWQAHPLNPIITEDPQRARPGGRSVVWEKTLLRFAQDCTPHYGARVRAFEVDALTPSSFNEREAQQSPILVPGDGWNRMGIHHVDAHGVGDQSWIGCVDGYVREHVSS